jgi:hypothetical protein
VKLILPYKWIPTLSPDSYESPHTRKQTKAAIGQQIGNSSLAPLLAEGSPEITEEWRAAEGMPS